VRDTRSASDAERPEGASGGFNVRGGWAGVRVSVDRASVVDGGCRGRDSRRRRPSKRERLTACSVRPKIGHLPRGPARPVAPASAAARRPSASLRTDYRKMERDRDRNRVLPRKPHRDSFRRRRRPQKERDGPLWTPGRKIGGRRPSKGRSPTQTAARATPPLLVTIASYSNPPYLMQISRSQRKSALLRRRVSARESSAPKSKSPRSRVEAHDTKNHQIDRSLAAKRQTVRGERQGPGAKDAPRRDLSNDTSIAVVTQ
jgi:hypothetical protein